MKRTSSKSEAVRLVKKSRSVKTKSRRFRFEFQDSEHSLEKRVLLTDITISSPGDIAAYFDSANNTYNINASGDSVTISPNVALVTTSVSGQASNIIISGGQISIGSNVSIVTDGSSGSATPYNSGNIQIFGKNVAIGNNVLVSANGANDSLDGNITISADNQNNATFGYNAWMQIEDIFAILSNQSATVDIGAGATIIGGDIAIDSSSGDPLQFETFTNISGAIANMIVAKAGHPNLLSLPFTFQSWSPESDVSINNNVSIKSSSTIDVNATTESNAKGMASWFQSLSTRLAFAVGTFFTDARANITVSPGAALQANGNITIATDVSNTIDLDVNSVKNSGQSPTNPDAVNLSSGFSSLKTNSVINVQSGSAISSSLGTVDISASATDKNNVSVDGKSYRDGLATVSIGMLTTQANVQAIVDGYVSSGLQSSPIVPATELFFNQVQSVNLANSSLTFAPGTMTYQTGQKLTYDTSNGSAIPGLLPGQVYYAIVNPSQPDSLQLAATPDDAQNGINITFQSIYPTLTIGNIALPITLIDNVYSNAILFNFNTLPNGSPVLPGGNGSTVTYTPVAGQFIGVNDANGNLIGPLAAGNYTVNLFQWPANSTESQLYPLSIQLINSQGQTVVLNPNSYFSTSGGTNFQVSLFNTATSTVDFNFEQPTDNPPGLTPLPVPNQQVNFANGETLVYTAGLNAPIGNLVNGQMYWAEVDPNQPGIIQLATSQAQSQSANPAIQNAMPTLLTVADQACLASTVADNFTNAGEKSTLNLNSDNSYSLSNNAGGGTFQLTVNGPEGSFTTAPLAYNISAADFQASLNAISGIQATVSAVGSGGQSWSIAIQFNIIIGNFQNDTELTFDNNPLIPDGTAVIFNGVPEKPVPGLVSGQTYYTFNQTNPDFISQFPQYILSLKATNNATAPDVSVNLSQTMTDGNGLTYEMAYKDANSGLISLFLPEVTAPAIGNGGGLVGGTVSVNQLNAPALVVYSQANSGTFTLSLTNTAGTTVTTSAIAYNASAIAFQQALNALTGVNVTVFGDGTYTSPWTIVGLDSAWSVSGDSSQLTYNGVPTSVAFDVFSAGTQQIWLNGATAGTFTVTLNFGSNQLVTAALPYNISRSAFAQAINASGFQAAVYGSGTATDPWQFLAYYNPIQTGDALTFNDAWNNPSLGMIDGQTYYAVTSSAQFSADQVMLSIATSPANATATPPVLLNMQPFLQFQPNSAGVISGQGVLIALPEQAPGVSITATLHSRDYLTNKADIGDYPPIRGLASKWNGEDPFDISKINPKKESLKKATQELYKYISGGDRPFDDPQWQEMKNEIQKNKAYIEKFDYKDPQSFLEASLGLAVMAISNNSQVIIGSNAQIISGGSVNLNSLLVDQFHIEADAGVVRTRESESKSGNLATALGLAVAVLDNTSQTVVMPNAVIVAADKITVNSQVIYPPAWAGTQIASIITNWPNTDAWKKAASITSVFASIVSQALNGTNAGLGDWLFNSSTNSATVQHDHHTEELLGSAIGGSVNIVSIYNNNSAIICDGAQINQGNMFSNTANQGLSVSATTSMEQISGVGQLDYFLNLAGIFTRDAISGNKSANLLGGSVNVMSMDNSTEALIGGNPPANINANFISANGPTRINYGDSGLALSALTDIFYIQLSQSGGSAVNVGLEASVAVASVESQNTTAAILSASNAPVISNNAGTTGNISITAGDNTVLTPSSGGFLAGKAINLGFSSSVVLLNRNVSAWVGNANLVVLPDQATWPVIQSAGNITISATASGTIVPVSLAGSVISKKSNETGAVLPFTGSKSHFGLGVSADYSEATVDDSVYAGINGGSLAGVSNQQALTILSKNSTSLKLLTGAASLAFERGRDTNVGLAGSAGFTDYSSNVVAGVFNAIINDYSVDINAVNAKSVLTCAAGLDGASVAGIGIEVAGSVAINHVTNNTVAQIAETTGTDLGTLNLQAIETDNIWAAAGTVTFAVSLNFDPAKEEDPIKAKIGLGLGFAQNLLNSTTHAIISDSSLSQAQGNININAAQASKSFVLAAGAVFEFGQGTGITIYGMIAENQYVSADVQALVENSCISSTSTSPQAGMMVASQLVPIMITAAGDLGLSIAFKVGTGSAASVGAGVSVTNVSITGNSVASVGNSTITLGQGNLTVNAYTGQSSNATNLVNTLANLNLPTNNYNLYSLSIAGGLTSAFSPSGDLALGLDGVGAGIQSSTAINTLANISSGSQIQLFGNNNSGGAVSIGALENLIVYDNAGGASISIEMAKSDSIGIAVGVGNGLHQSTNQIIAGLFDSNTTTAGDLNVTANSTSSVTVIGFGVALDVSIAESGGFAFGLSASAAIGTINSTETIAATITGGNITSGGALNVIATDNSYFYTGLGSGSLSVTFGTEGGAALGAGASISQINPAHTIAAIIGDTDSGSSITTNIIATGPVTILATNNQVVIDQAIAVASSVAVGAEGSGALAGAGASACVTTNNNITAGLLYGAVLTSLNKLGTQAVTITARDHANITSTVGTGAIDVAISEIPVGASVGISLSQITNNDNVQSLVRGAGIITQGGSVSVQAVGNNNHFSKSVATSISIALGIAGAGGNSNIYDNANFFASVDNGSSIVLGNNTTGFGGLNVLANSSETVLAQIFGGSAGLGSIGVYMSDAIRAGSTVANLTTAGNIESGSLTVLSVTNQTITSEGMSVTVGGLAGTGETHTLNINELLATNINGSNNAWNVHGNLLIGSLSGNTAKAATSGAGNEQASVSVSEYGVGFFKVSSAVNPTVNVGISNVNLTVAGSTTVVAAVNDINNAKAMAGSGSLVGGDAAVSVTDNSPTVSLSTSDLTLNSGKTNFLTISNATYAMDADSIYATAIGGSAAVACNTSAPNISLNLGTGTAIQANGTVTIAAISNITGLGSGGGTKSNGFMSRVGSGSIVGGYGASTVSSLVADSAINIGNGVSVAATGGSSILIGSAQNWSSNQLTYVDTGSAAGGTVILSTLSSCLTNAVNIGSNATLSAPGGAIGIGTNVFSQTSTDCFSYTFGLVQISTSNASNNQCATQSVTIGDNAGLTAASGIVVTPGYNPVSHSGSTQEVDSVVSAHCTGLISVPVTNACATSASDMSLNVGTGTQIISDQDVELGPLQGFNNALWYTFWNWNGDKGKTKGDNTGTSQSSCVTINGTVIAGNTHTINIAIPESGNVVGVNGQNFTWSDQTGNLVTVSPQSGQAFIPFQAGYQPNFNATQLLSGLDPTSQLILKSSISTSPVPAITLANLMTTGGQVVINADTLAGNANIYAYSPNITITNNSPAYLLVNGMNIPDLLNMGNITIVGSASKPSGMAFNQDPATPSISISQNYCGPVGTGTTSGPAVAVTGPITNTGGSVTVTNANGALVQIAPINAVSVRISTPNSAFIANTPNSYFGTGGSIMDYWENSSSYIVPGLISSSTSYTADLAATTSADAIYLSPSGATNSSDFSSWLYNNLNIGITQFINFNISPTDLGSNYPDSTGYWRTQETGTGIVFFGSEIPYFWQTSPINIVSGANYLSQSCATGYLDTYDNASIYSVAASGNSAAGSLNIAQGWGPMYADNVGRGLYPIVPSNFPTGALNYSPQNANLGSGITASQIDINALVIDINAPLNVSVINNSFQANLSSSLDGYIADQLAGGVQNSCIPLPSEYLGGPNTTLSGYFDTTANEIVLSPVAINGGTVAVVLSGQIISTTNSGKISLTSNPGQNQILNSSSYPLVLQGVSASSAQSQGIVLFQDTLAQKSTAFVYQANNVVQQYQGPLGANLSQMTLTGNQAGTGATYAPDDYLIWEWTQTANISRNLSFTQSNNNYWLYGSGVNDSWSWGTLNNGVAPANYSVPGNPFVTVSSTVMTGVEPYTTYFEDISPQITVSETAQTYFYPQAPYAWNFGPSTVWTWTYPTEIALSIFNHVPACNPIQIDFSGVSDGSLTVNSDPGLLLQGNIKFPGQVSLISGQNITQTSGAQISACQVSLTASGMLGCGTNAPININLISNSPLNAQAAGGVYLNSTGNLNLGLGAISATSGPVSIQSATGMTGATGTVNVSGTNISLLASNGTIGTQAAPISIQTMPTTLVTGSLSGGLLTASAPQSIYLNQPQGDLRIASVTTSSPVGVVSISTSNGNITNGLATDVYNFNSGNLTPQQINNVIDSIRLDDANAANQTVSAYEGSVYQNYQQYWTLVANATTIGNLTLNNGVYGLPFPLSTAASGGGVNLTANGVQYYQQQANLYYANSANQTTTANQAQVNAYANIIFYNAVNCFQNNMAYGPTWSALPQFQSFQSNFNFTASNATINALTYGAFDATNSYAILSLEALSPKGQETFGNSTAPVIQTSVLNLNASGSVGLLLDPVEIDMSAIQSGNLTPAEKSLLAQATNAGELQYVGINADGQKVVYSAGNEPANVTLTGVVVKIDQPLAVNLSSSGLGMLQAGTTINLIQNDGNLNLLNAVSSGRMSLVSQQDLNQIQLQSSTTSPGWSHNRSDILGYRDGDTWQSTGFQLSNINSEILCDNSPTDVSVPSNLRLVAGGSINTGNVSVSGLLNAYTEGNLTIVSQGNLELGEIYATGPANINASGNITGSDNQLKGSIGGFGQNVIGTWSTNSIHANAAIADNILTLTNNAAQPDSTAGWGSFASGILTGSLPVDNGFIGSFVYQSQTPGSLLSFSLLGPNDYTTLTSATGQIPQPAQLTQSVSFVIHPGNGGSIAQYIALGINGTLYNIQAPGSINLSSNDPIQVVLTHNPKTDVLTVTLTDTVTNQTYSFSQGNLNLPQILGGVSNCYPAFLSWGTQNATLQTIQGFNLSYGSPTIQSQSIDLNAGGIIGAANSPILTLVPGNFTATAPAGVYLLQTDGDMYVQSIISGGNVSLSAPVGSVVSSGGSQIQAASVIQAASAIQTASVIPTASKAVQPGRVLADHVQLQSLFSIGSTGRPLEIQASGLSATAVMGDIRLNQTGSLLVDGPVTAGQSIELSGDSGINLNSAVIAKGPIFIETLPGFAGESRIIVGDGGSVISTQDRVNMVGGDGLSVLAGATIASLGTGDNSHVLLASLAGELPASQKFDLIVNGAVRADQILMQSRSDNHNHYLNLTNINGLTQNPTIFVDGDSDNNTLTLNDQTYPGDRRVLVDNKKISTPDHLIELDAVDHVIMALGSGNDIIDIGRTTGLTSLSINCGPGDDTIRTVLSSSESLSQTINGGLGKNQILIDADNQPVWMKPQQVATLNGAIQFQQFEQVVVSRTNAGNALPVADRFVFENVTPDKPLTNREYVVMAYQQILNRNATAQELAVGTRRLDRNAENRETFARRLLSGTESLRIQINAWYLTYLNRPATGNELSRNVAALRSGVSAKSLVSRILISQEFYARTQQISQSGTPSDRYLTGMYRLAIDPTGSPDASLMQFLQNTLRAKGRQAVALQVLGSAPNDTNQTQAIFVKVNHKPADGSGSITVGKLGPNGLTARLLSRK